ncbi:MAG: TetR/AcrR family transcriptional regulator [Lactobacillales bacterium]|jgi:AcrR family transcriptional regulator|nr:TetR/AcrR family transcriptional regulator [Lactobacillales bacterium]
MARRKTITREQILDAAYDLVATEGFSHFTARNIANKIGCSTQPIYLEFKNMAELRDNLFDRIYAYLSNSVYPTRHTGDPIVDLSLNYIKFAKNESRLYRALFLEDSGGGSRMNEFSYNYFSNLVRNHETYSHLSEEMIKSLLNGTWIVATGIANLAASGSIRPTEEQKIQLIKDSIQAVLGLDHVINLNY